MDMMSVRRRVLMEQNGEKFLECDGTFYFDTSYIPTANTQVIVKFSAENDNNINNPIFGSRVTASSQQFLAWARIDVEGRLRVQRINSGTATTGNFDYTLDPMGKYIVDTKRRALTLDGETAGTWNYPRPFEGGTYPFYIGAVNNGGSPLTTVRFIGKLYYFQIYENDVLAVNYVPFNGKLRDTINGTILIPIYA